MKLQGKSRILLVEDDVDTRHALSLLLQLEGFDVQAVADGEQAFSMAMSGGYDLIVTDINMPRINGLDLIRLMKQHRNLSGVPIVAMSAVEKQHLDRAKELGAIAVYQKPIEFDNFLNLIGSLLTDSQPSMVSH